MSRFSLRQAEKNIVLDRFMHRLVANKGVSVDRIRVIPPWSHDEVVTFDAAGREEFRRAHGLNGKFVIMYSGNHSPDRKSTRLNSSHLVISYAVFCLKKKKKTT